MNNFNLQMTRVFNKCHLFHPVTQKSLPCQSSLEVISCTLGTRWMNFCTSPSQLWLLSHWCPCPFFGKDNFERNRNEWNVVLFCVEYGVEITQKEVFSSKGCCEGTWVPASFLHLSSEKILQCDAYLFYVRPFNAGLL